MSFWKNIFGNKNASESNSNQHKTGQEADLKKVIEILSKYKRTAYLPQIKKTKHEFSTASKIGGLPYLRNGHDWPVCPNCKKNLQLFLQLNLNELPERKDKGLIQLFYCTTDEPNCESNLEAFFPFSKAVCCRKIDIAGESIQIKPDIQEIFNEKVIVGWNPVDDYPHFEEYEQLGIEIDDDIYELMEEKEIGLPIEKDKLFGWPYWVQSVEYPFDRKTETQMELLFQLDSEDNLPYMFGDAGIGHLTQSPDNKEELGFGWACS
ncbi:DUF1963 domain-containing protein [Persicobacter diffluens]|uniref:DUF1963 domain-containing protein n=1 Tax=Persicobacter diffluens TaxID=981 RepID=A0AAN4W525_9BACT|nr:hypothetical protein PEDI_48020 [Persicobacter diffluens]